MTKADPILDAVYQFLDEQGCNLERGRDGHYFARLPGRRSWWFFNVVYDHATNELEVEMDNNHLTVPYYFSILDPDMFDKILVNLGVCE